MKSPSAEKLTLAAQNALDALSALGLNETPDASEGWFCRADSPDTTETTFYRIMREGVASGKIEYRKFGARNYYREINEIETKGKDRRKVK